VKLSWRRVSVLVIGILVVLQCGSWWLFGRSSLYRIAAENIMAMTSTDEFVTSERCMGGASQSGVEVFTETLRTRSLRGRTESEGCWTPLPADGSVLV
jgi:hypothetical protein